MCNIVCDIYIEYLIIDLVKRHLMIRYVTSAATEAVEMYS